MKNQSKPIKSTKDIELKEWLDALENIINDIKQNIPIQYILGEAHFYDLKFKVNSSTLIPRGETEELVQYILLHDFISVLEIGTGSGCIAVSIAKNSNSKITATPVALSTAPL